jgi:hypothetical protein
MLIKKKKQTTCLISVSNKDDKYRKLLWYSNKEKWLNVVCIALFYLLFISI